MTSAPDVPLKVLAERMDSFGADMRRFSIELSAAAEFLLLVSKDRGEQDVEHEPE